MKPSEKLKRVINRWITKTDKARKDYGDNAIINIGIEDFEEILYASVEQCQRLVQREEDVLRYINANKEGEES